MGRPSGPESAVPQRGRRPDHLIFSPHSSSDRPSWRRRPPSPLRAFRKYLFSGRCRRDSQPVRLSSWKFAAFDSKKEFNIPESRFSYKKNKSKVTLLLHSNTMNVIVHILRYSLCHAGNHQTNKAVFHRYTGNSAQVHGVGGKRTSAIFFTGKLHFL